MVDHATLVIADSVIETMPTYLSLHDSATVEIIRTVILQKEALIIQNHRNTSITIDNIKIIYQEEAKRNSRQTGVTVSAASHCITVTVTVKFVIFLSNFFLLYSLSHE
ncbi:hypothetical protein OTU49_006727 [Cherax quadricarinatus]|uniref:Uncharacterized protein n=1 Tax=Cherax quadricarinatus TaxID=27406 RepID=A0AAW0WZK2_CHEQU